MQLVSITIRMETSMTVNGKMTKEMVKEELLVPMAVNLTVIFSKTEPTEMWNSKTSPATFLQLKYQTKESKVRSICHQSRSRAKKHRTLKVQWQAILIEATKISSQAVSPTANFISKQSTLLIVFSLGAVNYKNGDKFKG